MQAWTGRRAHQRARSGTTFLARTAATAEQALSTADAAWGAALAVLRDGAPDTGVAFDGIVLTDAQQLEVLHPGSGVS